MINTRSLSIVIDKPIPLSIELPTPRPLSELKKEITVVADASIVALGTQIRAEIQGELDAKMDKKIIELDAKLDRKISDLDAKTDLSINGVFDVIDNDLQPKIAGIMGSVSVAFEIAKTFS